jgi:hypothetical protein
MAIIARGIRYLNIDDAVDLDGDVVLGDGLLVVYGEGFLLERMDIGDSINERDQGVDPRAERLEVPAEPLHHERLLLRHDAQAQVHRSPWRSVPAVCNTHARTRQSWASTRRFRNKRRIEMGA